MTVTFTQLHTAVFAHKAADKALTDAWNGIDQTAFRAACAEIAGAKTTDRFTGDTGLVVEILARTTTINNNAMSRAIFLAGLIVFTGKDATPAQVRAASEATYTSQYPGGGKKATGIKAIKAVVKGAKSLASATGRIEELNGKTEGDQGGKNTSATPTAASAAKRAATLKKYIDSIPESDRADAIAKVKAALGF